MGTPMHYKYDQLHQQQKGGAITPSRLGVSGSGPRYGAPPPRPSRGYTGTDKGNSRAAPTDFRSANGMNDPPFSPMMLGSSQFGTGAARGMYAGQQQGQAGQALLMLPPSVQLPQPGLAWGSSFAAVNSHFSPMFTMRRAANGNMHLGASLPPLGGQALVQDPSSDVHRGLHAAPNHMGHAARLVDAAMSACSAMSVGDVLDSGAHGK
jgi:hypothetical protein